MYGWLLAGLMVAHPPLQFAIAWPETPFGVREVADQSFEIRWFDATNSAEPVVGTGTVTFDFFYTSNMPRTYTYGRVPPGLDGTLIQAGVPESDPDNQLVWDTSAVPAGSYFIYTVANDTDSTASDPVGVAFSRGVVTVQHPGDQAHPAITFSQPDNPFHFATDGFELRYLAFDPAGDAQVRLEASSSTATDEWILLAEGLPAEPDNGFEWSTVDVREGPWSFRATLVDGRQRTAVAYSRFFVTVLHFEDLDAGVALDAAAAPSPPDAGALPPPIPRKSGCRCATPASSERGGRWAWVVIVLAARRRSARSRRAST